MLILLYLILINTYNSVDAPSRRGFSLIETWFYGTQVPVLLAIAEYGMILFIMKVAQKDALIQGMKMEMVYKWIDLCSFTVTLVYLILFNIVYWMMA